MTKETAIKLFEQKQIRSFWKEEDEKWYFSIMASIISSCKLCGVFAKKVSNCLDDFECILDSLKKLSLYIFVFAKFY